jgi:hypothetical protein
MDGSLAGILLQVCCLMTVSRLPKLMDAANRQEDEDSEREVEEDVMLMIVTYTLCLQYEDVDLTVQEQADLERLELTQPHQARVSQLT